MKKTHEKKRRRFTKATSIVLALCLVFTFCLTACNNTTNTSNENNAQKEAPSEQNNQQGQPPDKPDGEAPSGQAPGGTPPDGNSNNNAKPDEANSSNGPGANGGGANTQNYDYSGSYSASLTADGKESTSSEDTSASDSSTNAILAQNGGTLRFSDASLSKTGDLKDGDSCNFYGVNSVALSVGSDSKLYISNADINSNATGANAIFATDGAYAYVNNTTINSTKDNSRGLDATYGGTIIANSATINTQGAHCAGVATDRGGGNISIANSTISTSGEGSPIFYSTGALEANAISGTASGSQIACIEGLNSLLVSNSSLESTQTTSGSGDGVSNAVMVYQSTSGDADTSTGQAARLQFYNSTLKSSVENGSMFYFTNTKANVVLSGNTLDYDSNSSKLITVAGNDGNKNWGSVGKNGATVSFAAHNQQLNGEIEADTISSISLYLLDSSTYTGFTTITENSNGSTVDEPLTVNISSDSKWVVTQNCTVSNLNAEDGAQIVDSDGKTVTVVANGKTVVDGESDITVTVNNKYSNTVNTSDDQQLQQASIDRSEFDTEYATQTSFDGISESGSLPAKTDSNDGSTKTKAIVGGCLAAIVLVAIICVVAYKTQRPKRKNDDNDDGDDGDSGGSDGGNGDDNDDSDDSKDNGNDGSNDSNNNIESDTDDSGDVSNSNNVDGNVDEKEGGDKTEPIDE